MTVICKGTTAFGWACRNKVKNGTYCHCHKNQQPVVVLADVTMEFYPYLLGGEWPSLEQISKKVVVLPSEMKVRNYITSLMPTTLFQAKMEFGTIIFSSIEIIKANISVLNDPIHYDRFVMALINKLDNFPEFAEYLEEFKRKCHMKYREEARNRVNCWYFKHLDDLCPDVIEKIISLV